MMLPLNDDGGATGLLCGFAFGYVLENAGFSSARKLTAQFELRDWSLFKVMFPAIIVAAFGLQGLAAFGVLDPSALYMPRGFLLPTLLGGMLVGIGFVVGGYCPGTSLAALASGRADALVFLAGMLAGTLGFAGVYEFLGAWLEQGALPARQTLADLLNMSPWLVLALLAAAAAAGCWFGARMERSGVGPVDVEEALRATAGRPDAST